MKRFVFPVDMYILEYYQVLGNTACSGTAVYYIPIYPYMLCWFSSKRTHIFLIVLSRPSGFFGPRGSNLGLLSELFHVLNTVQLVVLLGYCWTVRGLPLSLFTAN